MTIVVLGIVLLFLAGIGLSLAYDAMLDRIDEWKDE